VAVRLFGRKAFGAVGQWGDEAVCGSEAVSSGGFRLCGGGGEAVRR
jgi:hypothetical protein